MSSFLNSSTRPNPGKKLPFYTYANFYVPEQKAKKGAPEIGRFYPDVYKSPKPEDPYVINERRFDILESTKLVNAQVHQQIRNVNPNSVWLNYQLVGTQFQAVKADKWRPYSGGKLPKPSNDPTNINQPLYLANLVIETNIGLQQFQGMPPTKRTLPFKHDANNMRYATGIGNYGGFNYKMGGCMGCHGVAQTKGYAFSFVLLLGHGGATTDTQKVTDTAALPK